MILSQPVHPSRTTRSVIQWQALASIESCHEREFSSTAPLLHESSNQVHVGLLAARWTTEASQAKYASSTMMPSAACLKLVTSWFSSYFRMHCGAICVMQGAWIHPGVQTNVVSGHLMKHSTLSAQVKIIQDHRRWTRRCTYGWSSEPAEVSSRKCYHVSLYTRTIWTSLFTVKTGRAGEHPLALKLGQWRSPPKHPLRQESWTGRLEAAVWHSTPGCFTEFKSDLNRR